VKNQKLTVASISCGLSLLLAAGGAAADPLAINTTPAPATQNALTGSDTLESVTTKVIAAMQLAGTISQITTYNGLGSSQGQRQLEGNPNTGEPTCTPTDANGGSELNPGCEEIAPMSRVMNTSICEDEVSSGSNTTAEHLAICADGIVMITDNAAHGQFAETAAQCPSGTSDNTPSGGNFYTVNATYAASGKLRNAGTLPGVGPGGADYVIGANGLAGWKDVLRLVYTGCRNDQGDCAAVTRTSRCTGGSTNPTRQAVIDRWDFLVESGAVAGDVAVDCNGATANTCASGLRAAYRRDDSSGTTGVFLSLLSLGSNLTARTTSFSGVPAAITAISETHMFCDGGDNEDWLPGATAAPAKGDPIAKACKAEDDLCNCNGQMGVVRAVRSPLANVTNDVNYPLYQCTRGSFALVPWINTSLPLCPDGTKPSAGNCKLPYFNDTSTSPATRRFNCINDAGSRPVSASSCDGRAYNFVMRDDAGVVRFRSGNLPQGALMRHNVRLLDTVLPVPGGLWPANTKVCEEADATRAIGCIVANTTCTMGWAGREAAVTDPFDNTQEPFRLNGFAPSDTNVTTVGAYPFSRDLYISAIGGFENITADCQARNGNASSQYCADEVAIAQAFYDMDANAVNACATSGFIPKAVSECVGAFPGSGCGSTSTTKTDCDPQ
jgi:hypothetical protein